MDLQEVAGTLGWKLKSLLSKDRYVYSIDNYRIVSIISFYFESLMTLQIDMILQGVIGYSFWTER
jgi:hypothetical protein